MDDSDADTGDLNSSDGDSVPSLKGIRMKNEDMKSSRFTEYSMSSSVMRRNDQLTLLDDRFEQVQNYQIILCSVNKFIGIV
jgi:protein LTV1